MSNSLAIAATTATLNRILTTRLVQGELPDGIPASFNLGNIQVTNKPPAKARPDTEKRNQVNLFLYQVATDAALANHNGMPHFARNGEAGRSPLALTLHYLLTAYGNNDDDTAAHILLGQSMLVLHDNAVLGPDQIRGVLGGSDLHQQLERVRVTLLPSGADEMSKLWTSFQSDFRVSAAYEVRAVLIESARPARAALPVLSRGEADRGPEVVPSVGPFTPTLNDVAYPDKQFVVRLGESITLQGALLSGAPVDVLFRHTASGMELSRPATVAGSNAEKVVVAIDDAPADWLAGTYAVTAAITQAGKRRLTNEIGVALAPQIIGFAPAHPPTGDFTLSVQCKPQVGPEQRVRLFLGSGEFRPETPIAIPANAGDPSTLTFNVTGVGDGRNFIRLRVDGVDSVLIRYVGVPAVPELDLGQAVEVGP